MADILDPPTEELYIEDGKINKKTLFKRLGIFKQFFISFLNLFQCD